MTRESRSHSPAPAPAPAPAEAGGFSAQHGHRPAGEPADLAEARRHARAQGTRWTPQRELLLAVLADSDGHIGGAELVKRCRAFDATTTPSTVYRNLDLLEELGVVSHHRHPSGREEYHYRQEREHGHLYCRGCGQSQEICTADLAPVVDALRRHCGFEVDIAHAALVGLCAACRAAGPTSL
jgi:Fur family ferric uptake transcriptional regulator